MHENNPWYWFHPDSPGWIIRRHRQRMDPEGLNKDDTHVSAEDVARVVEANPSLVPDPVIRDYVVKGLRSKLPRPRGRPKNGIGWLGRIFMARDLVRERIAELKEAQRQALLPVRKRGDPGLSEMAHEDVARRMRLGSGRSLANAISSLNDHALFRE